MVIVQKKNVTVVMYYKWIGRTVWLVGSNSSRFFVDYYRIYCTDCVAGAVVLVVVVVVGGGGDDADGVAELVIVGLWSNKWYSKLCDRIAEYGPENGFNRKTKSAQLNFEILNFDILNFRILKFWNFEFGKWTKKYVFCVDVCVWLQRG